MPELEFVATSFKGLEKVLENEIRNLGGSNIRAQRRAVSFTGSYALMYRMNFALRTAIRVLYKLRSFRMRNDQDFYEGIYRLPWENFVDHQRTIAVKAVGRSPLFNNSHYVALKAKDAIVDRVRDKTGKRPSVDAVEPDIPVHIHINNQFVDISLDSSGDPLFKRGYRMDGFEAPLNEALAAGLIMLSGWNGQNNFIDPMCGSGTLSIEAAMIARGIPPGVFRSSFAFRNWNDFDEPLYNRVVDELMVSRDFHHKIIASDIAAGAFRAASKNIKQALLEDMIQLSVKDFFEKPVKTGEGTVILNPPYGERIKRSNMNSFYQKMGDRFKNHYQGHDVWVLSANLDAMKYIGLKPSAKYSLLNGKLDCLYNKYEIFSGKRSDHLSRQNEDKDKRVE